MISEVVMPQMGADMTEGTLLRWLKQEGEQVERGEIIAEIETDKANIEIEAFGGGVFRKTLADEGDIVQVGEVIAVIGAPEDDISKYGTNGASGAPAPAKAEKSAAAAQAAASEPAPEATARADAPPSAGAAAVPTVEATPTGDMPPTPPPPQQQPAGAAPAQPPAAAEPARPSAAPSPSADGRVRASPLARRIADERGIDLASVRGTGPGGRVVKKDVESFKATPAAQPATAAPATPAARPARAPAAPTQADTVIQQSKMRQRIAARMAQSKREAPHYYLLLDIDMTEAMAFRSQVNATLAEDARVSVNDLIVRACALALQQHPAFNATIADDQVTQHAAEHICIAVALDDGLIAPAIVNAGTMSLREIAVASRDLADRARNGSLRADEVSAGTFTISNLGAFGVEILVAIIQPPQTAILGVGTVAEQAVVRDGDVVARQMMKVALSADHRVTDGAQGARFIAEIKRLLESPLLLVL